jgi:hypothetical protein
LNFFDTTGTRVFDHFDNADYAAEEDVKVEALSFSHDYTYDIFYGWSRYLKSIK